MWRIDPSLSVDSTTATVSGQRLRIQVPAGRNMHEIIGWKEWVSTLYVLRYYKHWTKSVVRGFFTGVCEDRKWEREAEAFALLKPLPGNGS
jgi:hypothetical protein